jgi:hypothetical protein
MRRDLPSGKVTFLVTDGERSTRLLHSLGAEGYADALASQSALGGITTVAWQEWQGSAFGWVRLRQRESQMSPEVWLQTVA